MITVLGSINMDLIANVPRLPRPGETVTGHAFATAPGGKGANQALAARRAGSVVKMVGACGQDAFAEEALSHLKSAGADLTLVRSVPGPTGVALIFVGDDGENVISVIAGANGTVSVDEASSAIAAMKAGDSLMLQMEIPRETIKAALVQARAAGIRTILNTAPMTDDAIELSALADIVIANETEFELLCGKSGLDATAREAEMLSLAAQRNQTFIVTLGADGVVATAEGIIVRARGLVIEPVDTVGAGDTFCGYLAASLESGMSLERALRRAAAAGSLACTRHGAQPSIPEAGEVDVAIG
jgi:ribokinase